MTDSSIASRYKRPSNVVAREVGGEQVLLPLRKRAVDLSSVYVLNPVAKFIWDQLDGNTSTDEIVERVADEFEVSREVASEDARAFVAELVELELVERAG